MQFYNSYEDDAFVLFKPKELNNLQYLISKYSFKKNIKTIKY